MASENRWDELRCPLKPSTTRVLFKSDHFECERCALRFSIRDGFPVMIVEEAQLPQGCDSIADLPCQRTTTSQS
jgi:uncharacterized protein YbaR (Trm112 family)